MNQSNSSQQGHSKQRGTLMAVGGFVVGASAMAAVVGLRGAFGVDESAFLRGSDTSVSSAVSPEAASFNSTPNNSSQVTLSKMDGAAISTASPTTPLPTVNPTTPFPTDAPMVDGEFPTDVLTVRGGSDVISASGASDDSGQVPTAASSTPVPTFNPSVENTMIPTDMTTVDGDFPTDAPTAEGELNATSAHGVPDDSSQVPTAAPSTPFPTFNPSVDNTMIPTDVPTVYGEFPTDVPTEQREIDKSDIFTSLLILRKKNEVLKEAGFRLRLYWEGGYFWQEKADEKWWCMACPDGKCEKDSSMELRNCKKKSDKDATFAVASDGNSRHRFRVTDTQLCLQKMGKRRAVNLKACKANEPLQLFAGYDPNKRFDLRPVGYAERCLSQHHHPKAGETIYAETCKKAHRTDTGYWVAY